MRGSANQEAIAATSAFEVRRIKASLRARLFHEPQAPLYIGRFRVVRRLGSGATGTVYLAHDDELERDIAIKLLHGIAALDGGRERSRREARALAGCVHPNIVTIYDVGEVGGQLFIAMELVDGVDLRTWMVERERSAEELVDVFVQAGRGLAAAHRRGVIHRDFKPENVVVDDGGTAKIVDFGLALRTDVAGAAEGTPKYMAPECVDGAPVDARADQYAFCLSLAEALHFEVPTWSRGSSRALPGRIEMALRRGLAKDPSSRWSTIDELLVALAPRRRTKKLVAMVAPAVLVALGAVVLTHDQPCPKDGPQRQLAGVWDDTRRTEIERLFRRSGAATADALWSEVSSRLDEQARRWTELESDTCRARQSTPADPQVLRRAACTSALLQEMRAVSDLLAQADLERLESSPAAAAALTPTSVCTDAKALRMQLDLPSEPAQQQEVVRIRAELSRGHALARVGDLEEALAVAEDSLVAARASGYRPLEAEAHYLRALALGWSEPSGQAALADMAVAAAASAHHEMVALSAAMLADAGDEHSVRRAQAAIDGLGGHARAQAWLHHKAALAHEEEGAWEAAYEAWTQAAREMRRAGDEAASALFEFNATELGFARDQQSALDDAQRAYETLTRVHGAGHPTVAAVGVRLGRRLARTEPKQAFTLIEQSARRLEQLLAPDDDQLLHIQLFLHEQAGLLGDHREALARARRVVESARGSSRADKDIVLGDALVAMAITWAQLGEAEKVDALLLEAQPHLERCESGSSFCDNARLQLSQMQAVRLAQRERCTEASATVERQSLIRGSGWDSASDIALAKRLTRAEVLLECGRPSAALGILEEERERRRDLEYTRLLGRVHLELGNLDEARGLLMRVHDKLTHFGAKIPPDLSFALARASLAVDLDGARAFASEAIAGYAFLGDGHARNRARVQKWLRDHG